MRSGLVVLNHGYSYGVGWRAYVWSSVASVNQNDKPSEAYLLLFDILEFSPSAGPGQRHYGFPVRCLASGA